MSIETLDDIVGEVADKLNVYGSCKRFDENGNDRGDCPPKEYCRICFESELKERIRSAISIEQRLKPAKGEQS